MGVRYDLDASLRRMESSREVGIMYGSMDGPGNISIWLSSVNEDNVMHSLLSFGDTDCSSPLETDSCLDSLTTPRAFHALLAVTQIQSTHEITQDLTLSAWRVLVVE